MPPKPKKPRPPATEGATTSTSNSFTPLLTDIETKEKYDEQKSKSELHFNFDKIWKSLISNRQKCRSLQYQFWAAILIEKDGIAKEDGGLEELIESILIDPKMGDQHISKLPPAYRDKMLQSIKITFLDSKSISGNVNKYSAFLLKWHSDLEQEIRKKVGDDYKIKDEFGNYIINPQKRIQIREIIENNPFAKHIRQKINLAKSEPQEKDTKEIKEKSGLDHYIDYLLNEDNEEAAQASLDKAAQAGYLEDDSEVERSNTIVSEEYYSKIFKKYFYKGEYKLLEKLLLKAANKNHSAIAQHILGEIYDIDCDYAIRGYIKSNPAESLKYYTLAAKQDFARAEHNLAYSYLDRWRAKGIKDDMDNALKFFKKSANHGDTDALNILGNIYYGTYGEIEKEDNLTAFDFWKKSADLGDEIGKHNLGHHYLKSGQIKEGINLIKEAEKLGAEGASHDLGIFYINAQYNIRLDIIKGIGLIEKAAAKGFEPSIQYLNENRNRINAYKNHPIYHIKFVDMATIKDPTLKAKWTITIKKIYELAKEIGLTKTVSFGNENEYWIASPLPSDKLTKEIRELLNIDRVRIPAINPEDREALLRQLPKATIENAPENSDPKNKDKILITWPIINKEKERAIIDKFTKRHSPGPVVQRPSGKAASEYATSQFK